MNPIFGYTLTTLSSVLISVLFHRAMLDVVCMLPLLFAHMFSDYIQCDEAVALCLVRDVTNLLFYTSYDIWALQSFCSWLYQ